MFILSRIGCLVNQHDPDRSKVTWGGRNYIGHCRHCGTPIERVARRTWRKRKHVGEDNHGTPTAN